MVGIALVILLTILFLPLQAIIFWGFSELEQRSIARDVERALNTLHDDEQRLGQLVRDYTAWDDTYAFAQGQNPGYITQNYNPSTFQTNRLNLVIILNTAGEVLAYETYQIEAARGAATDDELLRRILTSTLISQVGPDTSATTLLLLPGEPMLLSAHAILTSNYTGPSMGTMIMGRTLDAASIAQLGAQLRLDLHLHRLDQSSLPEAILTAANKLSETGAPVVTPQDPDVVNGYGLINSPTGKPMLLIQVISGREIMSVGRTTALYTLVAFVAAGMLATFTLTWLLNQLVLKRLMLLIESVHEIGAKRDLGRRVALDGNDEFSQLSDTIDETMEALEQAEHERREAEANRLRMWDDVIASRRNFLATISHELRTPLTPIRGYADLMLHGIGGEVTPEQRHYLQVIQQNSRRMEAMVNDLLIMGQLDAGRIELRLGRVDLGPAVASVLAMLEQQIAHHKVTVTSDIPAELPAVRADANRLDQILTNLINNAVKYTRDGGQVSIWAEQLADGQIAVAVRDTGIGISPKDVERVFAPFYRASSVLSEQISGTGLGLSITRALVEQHGGTISVESTLGEGSVFRFTLPADQIEHEAVAPLAQASTVTL